MVYEVYVANLVMVFQDDDFYDPDGDYDLDDGVVLLMVFTNNIIKENLMSGQQMFKRQDDYQMELKTYLDLHLILITVFVKHQNYF